MKDYTRKTDLFISREIVMKASKFNKLDYENVLIIENKNRNFALQESVYGKHFLRIIRLLRTLCESVMFGPNDLNLTIEFTLFTNENQQNKQMCVEKWQKQKQDMRSK